VVTTGDVLLLAGLGLAAVLGLLLWRPRRATLVQAFATVLIAYPAARALVAAAYVSPRLTTYTVLQPAPRAAFELAILHDVSLGILLPLAGALLLWRDRAGREEARGFADVRAALASALRPAGLRLADPDRRAAFLDAGALLGVTLVLQALALLAQQGPAAFLVTGDESRYWQNLTPALAVGLSFAAGASEEFVWRGLLFQALRKRVAYLPAVLTQAALFGFIHAGYGNWAHVVGPALFGLLMGVVAVRVGLLAAVVVHAGTDVAYLGLVVPAIQPWGLGLAAALLLAGVLAAVGTRLHAVQVLLRPAPWKEVKGPGQEPEPT